RGEDVALEGAGAGETVRLVERGIGELGGPPDIGELGRALDDAQPADELRGIGERAEAVEGGGEALAVARGEAIGLPFDAEPLAGAARCAQRLAQLLGRLCLGTVD